MSDASITYLLVHAFFKSPFTIDIGSGDHQPLFNSENKLQAIGFPTIRQIWAQISLGDMGQNTIAIVVASDSSSY